MPLLMLKDLPRYECLLKAAQAFPDLDPSAAEVFLHLLRSGDEVFRVVDRHFARHHISEGRFGVLMALWSRAERPGGDGRQALSPAELAEHTGVTRATITGLVDTLERDGLVARSSNVEDRRMRSVSLTPRGSALLRGILPEHFRRMAWLMATLDEQERVTLVRLLGKVMQRASEEGPESATGSSEAVAAAPDPVVAAHAG
ncbi:MAG: MarR family winged helix-turn-helix transcriptional regulator [Opitutaceae bacterium]